MEQVTKTGKVHFLLFTLMIAITSFEFFFRDGKLFSCWTALVFIVFLKKKILIPQNIQLLFIGIFVIFFFQSLAYSHYSILGCITRMIAWIGAFTLAHIVNVNYRKFFITIISIIAAYSLIIYLLSYIPSIREFLLYTVCPKFPSLGVENAIQEGGGQNFIIYNYQVDYLNEAIGFYRNCGPFWEPGMFACFLNIALFLNINYGGNKWISLLLIITTISTFSTGGFVGFLFVIFSYFQLHSKGNTFVYVLGIIFVVFLFQYLSSLSFVGLKVLNQLDNASVGTDASRFGAILTQEKMIEASPIIGGENIEQYTESGTLSSALLLPFVNFGLFIGSYIYMLLFKSCISNSYRWGRGKKEGIYLFLLILILSISQTITLNTFVLVMMFCGLVKTKKTYGTI